MKKTILIVEDNDDLRSSLRKILISNNFNVLEAADGAEALTIAEDSLPDLVLLDFVIPKVSGETVCVKIKKNHPGIIVIALTEKFQSKDVVHGLQIGADDYISKPFIEEELIARIDTRLKAVDTRSPSKPVDSKAADTTRTINLRESTILIAIRLIATELFFTLSFMLIITLVSLSGSYIGITNPLPLYAIVLGILFFLDLVLVILIVAKWRSEYTEVTKTGVVKHTGIIFKKEQKYACNFVEAIKVEQDFLGSLFNYGTVELYDPAQEEKIYLLNITNPKKNRATIEEIILKDVGHSMPFIPKHSL